MDSQFGENKPIFIVGSYRSGTSLLTWCLGQHPNILPLPETNWIAQLTIDLCNLYRMGTINGRYSHLGSLGWSLDTFFDNFGASVDQFIVNTKLPRLRQIARYAMQNNGDDHDSCNDDLIDLSRIMSPNQKLVSSNNYQVCRALDDPKQRWVDGTPENTHYIYGLAKLFPQARFVHILRNPGDIARSLMQFSNAGVRGKNFSNKSAYSAWIKLVESASQAEVALGSGRVYRLSFDDLITDSKNCLQSCLKFLGEEFSEDCLLPLKEKINSSYDKNVCRGNHHELGNSSERNRADKLYEMLTSGDGVPVGDDVEACSNMERKFFDYVESVSGQSIVRQPPSIK